MASVIVLDGKSCFLWVDLRWPSLETVISRTFSAAKNKSISLAKAHMALAIIDLFNLPLLVEAFQQLQHSEEILRSLILSQNPCWPYIWSSNNFASSKAYKVHIGHCSIHVAFKWLWNSSCQCKQKVFPDFFKR